MTPRARVEAVLRGEVPDKTPFTIYECMLPQCAIERDLRNRGLCVVERGAPVVNTITPNVTSSTYRYTEEGVGYVRTIYHTPEGELSTVSRPADFTSWRVERLFKGPEDYQRLRAMVQW